VIGVNEATDDGQGQQLEAILGADAHSHIGDMTDDGMLADAQTLGCFRTCKTNS
jgi:hypothetical protein